MSTPRAALSIDLERFAHTPAYRSAVGGDQRADPGTTPDRAVGIDEADWLRRELNDAGASATFFTVGEVAETHPETVRAIAADGHEIASHTHTHRHLTELTATERREELVESKRALEAAADESVGGFRAPSFDVADDHFRSLAAAGYAHDSSLIPCRSIPGWYGGDHRLRRPHFATEVDPDAPAELVEVPPAVMPGLRLPLTGTWLRFFGVRYTLAGMHWLARQGVAPVLYVHPWELADLPRVEGVPRRVYVRTGDYVRRAVGRILRSPFEFVTVGTLAAEATEAGTAAATPDVAGRDRRGADPE